MPSSKPVLETTPSEINKWDIDGDGQLDEAELALMKLDKENTGQLSKEDMHELMKEHLNSQRQLFTFKKKIAMGWVPYDVSCTHDVIYISLLIRIYASLPPHYTSLSLLVVIMAVGMLGLSFAAAILAKDTMRLEMTLLIPILDQLSACNVRLWCVYLFVDILTHLVLI